MTAEAQLTGSNAGHREKSELPQANDRGNATPLRACPTEVNHQHSKHKPSISHTWASAVNNHGLAIAARRLGKRQRARARASRGSAITSCTSQEWQRDSTDGEQRTRRRRPSAAPTMRGSRRRCTTTPQAALFPAARLDGHHATRAPTRYRWRMTSKLHWRRPETPPKEHRERRVR
jgi:hypothetical protein